MKVKYEAHCQDGFINQDLIYELDDSTKISDESLSRKVAKHYAEKYHSLWEEEESVDFKIWKQENYIGNFRIVKKIETTFHAV